MEKTLTPIDPALMQKWEKEAEEYATANLATIADLGQGGKEVS